MKNRRSFLKKLVAVAGSGAMFPFSKKAVAAEIQLKGALVHHVFFWLKEPENRAHKDKLVKALNELIKVETIKLSHIGFPAETENRDVVDHSYSVSYMAMFGNKNDQDAYQVHPIHLKFVEENSYLWEKVVVYDSMD